ncbi:hypothetical protein ZWY2020_040715 [Hordeum vulgare]|nr:hypothetical protein ZWY2020_040715 [Hordeum vulgare]
MPRRPRPRRRNPGDPGTTPTPPQASSRVAPGTSALLATAPPAFSRVAPRTSALLACHPQHRRLPCLSPPAGFNTRLSYAYLLPNDDEAFEHFGSFVSRKIEEVLDEPAELLRPAEVGPVTMEE